MRIADRTENTRVQATRWIFENVPGPIHLSIIDRAGIFHHEPVPAPDGLVIRSSQPFIQTISPRVDGLLSSVVLPHVAAQDNDTELWITIAANPESNSPLDQAIITIKPSSLPGQEAQGNFVGFEVKKGSTYYLIAKVLSTKTVTISRTVISNESWDEGLPFPFDGWDPFGQLYRGVTMEVRWYDDENKREMFLNVLSQSEYLILPSQRAIWTTCRIPRTYPMTMAYYRALFDGELGFDLVGSFSSPLEIGPLRISDVGGSLAINEDPSLPLFNHNLFAAEEAFSVYDHPPVWIFKKTLDYDQMKVEAFFYSLDLSKVVVQSPREADLPPCP